MPDVDLPRASGAEQCTRVIQIERNAEAVREIVCGPAGDDAKRGLASDEFGGDRFNSPVTASNDHKLCAVLRGRFRERATRPARGVLAGLCANSMRRKSLEYGLQAMSVRCIAARMRIIDQDRIAKTLPRHGYSL